MAVCLGGITQKSGLTERFQATFSALLVQKNVRDSWFSLPELGFNLRDEERPNPAFQTPGVRTGPHSHLKRSLMLLGTFT